MNHKTPIIIKRLQYLQDDMRQHYKALKELGFDAKHLEELKGACKIVRTWINGVREST